jgi:hypothetical protein
MTIATASPVANHQHAFAAAPSCARHGPKTARCLNCDAALCRGCRHYEINGRPWCATCAAPYRESLVGGLVKDLGKLAAIGATFVGVTLLAAATIRNGLFWGGIATSAVALKLLWPKQRIDLVERGGK